MKKNNAFEYSLSLETESMFFSNNIVVIRGRISHRDSSSISIVQGGKSGDLNLGFRIYDRNNIRVFEDRAKFDTNSLSPAIEYPFSIEIPRNIFDTKDLLCKIDLLYEGNFWFEEVGISCAKQYFINKHESVAASKTSDGQSGTAMTNKEERFLPSPVERIRKTFEKYDFSSYEAVSFVNNTSTFSNAKFSLPEKVLNSFNKIVLSNDDILPITALMAYYGEVKGWSSGKKLGQRSTRFDLLRDFFGIISELKISADDLIPFSIKSYLNELVLADGVFDIPMSRLMLWSWMNDGKSIRPYMRLDREDIYWWWVTAAMPAKRIPGIFVTDEVISYLGAPHEEFRGRILPLSRFFYRAYRESNALKAKYDLATDEGLLAYSFDTVIHNMKNDINSRLIGSATLDFWSSRVGSDRRDVTHFELALAHQVPEHRAELATLSDKDVRRVARAIGGRRVSEAKFEWWPLISENSRQLAPSSSLKAKDNQNPIQGVISLVGLLSSQSGLGVNSRMSRTTFENMGYKINQFDIQKREAEKSASNERSDFSLFHVNADSVANVVAESKSSGAVSAYNIGFFLWELNVLPKNHLLGVDLVDEIWVPTEFLRKVYAGYTKKPVVNVGKYLIIPELPAKKVSDGPFDFLISFDFHSGVERKNPLAAVKAFQAAFPKANKNVRLIVKTTESVPNHWGDPYDQWLQISEIARRDDRIVVISDIMSEESFFKLINSVDSVVTTHRAEGFGYLPAYGLYYGKSVISTDYSGTTDFCTPETAFLVSYTEKDLSPGEFITDVPRSKWADIVFDDLVEKMKLVYENNTERNKRQIKGAALIRERYSLQSQIDRYRLAVSNFK